MHKISKTKQKNVNNENSTSTMAQRGIKQFNFFIIFVAAKAHAGREKSLSNNK